MVVPAAAEADEGTTWIEVRVAAAFADEGHRARQPKSKHFRAVLSLDQGIRPPPPTWVYLKSGRIEERRRSEMVLAAFAAIIYRGAY